MSRIAVACLLALVVAGLLPLGAARAQLREPSCPTFAAMSDAEREHVVLGMLGGFVAATMLAQKTAIDLAADPVQAPGARRVSDRLSTTALTVQGQTPRRLAAKLREACGLGKNLASPANLVLLDMMLAAGAAPAE